MSSDRDEAAVDHEAHAWWARMRGPHDAADLVAFDSWLASDPRHQMAYERLEATFDRSRLAGDSEYACGRALRRAPFLARHPAAGYALAAAFAGVAMLGVAGYELRPVPAPVEVARTTRSYAGHPGELATIALSDGSRVILDSDARLRVALAANVRLLWLDAGRARFDVAHDPRRPFTVTTPFGSVTAHGTIFDVRVRKTGTAVALMRGSVDVRASAGASQRDVMLAPGQQATIAPNAASPTPAAAPVATFGWVPGTLIFNATPLKTAVAEFNGVNAAQVLLAPGVGDEQITGAFAGDDPQGFARAVAVSLRLAMLEHPNGDISLVRSVPNSAGPTAE